MLFTKNVLLPELKSFFFPHHLVEKSSNEALYVSQA